MKQQPLPENSREFLRESNAIEGVYDEASLEQALVAWRYLLTEDELTLGVVLRTHKKLMKNQPLEPGEIGSFRRVPVYIGGKEAIDHALVPELIVGWCFLANQVAVKEYSEEWIKQGHIHYEIIHPFVDGNGRTGRMFLNWQRVKSGLPILVIKESEKQAYYDWFK